MCWSLSQSSGESVTAHSCSEHTRTRACLPSPPGSPRNQHIFLLICTMRWEGGKLALRGHSPAGLEADSGAGAWAGASWAYLCHLTARTTVTVGVLLLAGTQVPAARILAYLVPLLLLRRSPHIPTDPCGSPQVPADPCGSPQIPADPLRSLRIPADPRRPLGIPADLADPGTWDTGMGIGQSRTPAASPLCHMPHSLSAALPPEKPSLNNLFTVCFKHTPYEPHPRVTYLLLTGKIVNVSSPLCPRGKQELRDQEELSGFPGSQSL